jgi:cell division protein FtsB
METRDRNIYGGIAILFLVLSIVLVYTGTITYQEALQGAPVWASVIFGIYNWRNKVVIKRDAEVIQEMLSNRIGRLKEENEQLVEHMHKLQSKRVRK